MFAFYLDEEDGSVTLRTECTYGEYQYDLLRQEPDGRRDLLRERQVLEVARSYFPYEDSERGLLCFAASQQDRMYQLLSTGSVSWEQEGKSMRRTVFSHIICCARQKHSRCVYGEWAAGAYRFVRCI